MSLGIVREAVGQLGLRVTVDMGKPTMYNLQTRERVPETTESTGIWWLPSFRRLRQRPQAAPLPVPPSDFHLLITQQRAPGQSLLLNHQVEVLPPHRRHV
jgi:hypothetical protein